MPVRYPAPLRPGDLVGVTAPSAGVPADLRPRLEFCVADLRRRGFEVRVGRCTAGDGVVSAPAAERAAELMGMLLDPQVRACGHPPPHLVLVNGALAELEVTGDAQRLNQTLV